MRSGKLSILTVGLALTLLVYGFALVPSVFAQTIAPPYSSNYTIVDLGSVSGLPTPYGGLTLLAGNTNELLIGGTANQSGGGIYQIGVMRGAGNHITGFSPGSATLFATAPQIDGGLAYGPGGVLFFTGFSNNIIGEIKPGSVSPDKTVSLTPLGVASSVGSLNFVPSGFPGAGDFKIASYNGGGFYDATLSSDGSGTYNISSGTLTTAPGGGPEGFVYVPIGSPDFSTPSLLLAQYSFNQVDACGLDSGGNPADPVNINCKSFITGLTGAEGAFLDPLTGDFLFSTFGGSNHVLLVEGFAVPPPQTLEPGTLSLMALGALSLLGRLRNRRTRS